MKQQNKNEKRKEATPKACNVRAAGFPSTRKSRLYTKRTVAHTASWVTPSVGRTDINSKHNLVNHPTILKVHRYVDHRAQSTLSSQSVADRIQSQLTRRLRLSDSYQNTRLFSSNGPQALTPGAYYLFNNYPPGSHCELTRHRQQVSSDPGPLTATSSSPL